MRTTPVSLACTADRTSTITAEIDRLVEEADVPAAFPAEVLRAAEQAAAQSLSTTDRADLRAIPFLTLDPAASTDLDQAMHLERTADGWVVRYAIADVPFFVTIGDPVDQEAHRRGTTIYLPDRRIPLHPEVLSEDTASLLPGQDRPAFVWTMTLDADGRVQNTQLERALVRSREKLGYDQVQQDLDAGSGHPMMVLLQELGTLRIARESERGGASLVMPEQEAQVQDGRICMQWRTLHPIESANAQISLMTGMAAAEMMLRAKQGILRTLPPADEESIRRFRLQSRALGIEWPKGQRYGDFLRTLDWTQPHHLALLNQAGSLFRGAGYLILNEDTDPQDAHQAAIGAPYAHVTAPLRRLADRFALLVCALISSGTSIPAQLQTALEELPEIMASTTRAASGLEKAALDRVELHVLAERVGEEFPATVISLREGEKPRAEVQLVDPSVTLWVEGKWLSGPHALELGTVVTLRLSAVDLHAGTVDLQPA